MDDYKDPHAWFFSTMLSKLFGLSDSEVEDLQKPLNEKDDDKC
jgi:hypothetical protein